MNSKERIIAALNNEPIDRVPWSPFLAYIWEHFPIEIRDAGEAKFYQSVGSDPLWRGAACPVKMHTPGIETISVQEGDVIINTSITPVGQLQTKAHYSPDGNTTFLVEHPIKTPQDMKVQIWIEQNAEVWFDDTDAKKHFNYTDNNGLSVGMLIPRGKTAYQQMIEHHIGTEEMAYAHADYPELIDELWHAMVENDLKAARLAADSDYEYFLTWEDSSTQNYSPNGYRKYIASEITAWNEILAAKNKKYIQHACGHIRDLLPIMVEQGNFGVESISPQPTGNVSIAEARQLIGNDLAIIGGIEPVNFLNLNIDDLKIYVQDLLNSERGRPFLLANSDSCPPGVAVEKFEMIGDLIREGKNR
jgi:hypothetical protein